MNRRKPQEMCLDLDCKSNKKRRESYAKYKAGLTETKKPAKKAPAKKKPLPTVKEPKAAAAKKKPATKKPPAKK